MSTNDTYSLPKLGEGIYTIPDASLILDFSKTTLRRWVNQYWKIEFTGKNHHASDGFYIWGSGRDTAFNFFTLIEIFTVISLRDLGVSFNKIKKARSELSEVFNTIFPFASQPLMSDGKKIIAELDNTNLLELGTGGQTALKRIIEPFCKKLDFNKYTDLAERFWPLGKKHLIVVDPKHGFGRPTITGTNIATETIYSLLRAGEQSDTVADLYNISQRQIDDVIAFQRRVAA